ncbi:MAG: hypothetical protein MK033_00530 [Candidatus Caenarcaniphilales bacterium]|nr:hypothetical protein [Candidatus Caenarcaniphilales bacterium]
MVTNSGEELDMLQDQINSHIESIDNIRNRGVEEDAEAGGYSANVYRGSVDSPAFGAGYAREFQVGTAENEIILLDFTDNNNAQNSIEIGIE